MDYAENILETIGNTPLVKLNKLVEELPCLVLAKYETFNPGNSVKDRMALKMIEDAAKQNVQIICLQELFYGPYFCAEQKTRWYEMVEKVPEGPTTKLFQEVAKKHNMVIIVPVYEEEMTGVFYNTAAVLDADGTYMGKYRK